MKRSAAAMCFEMDAKKREIERGGKRQKERGKEAGRRKKTFTLNPA